MNLDSTEATVAIVAVLIPTASGIIGSKWITNSWQSKKDELETRKQILEQLDSSYHRFHSVLANFINQLYRGYEDYTPKYDAKGNMISAHSRFFPTNTADMPSEKFNKEFAVFQKEHDELAYSMNSFGSSLALYFPSLLSKMSQIDDILEIAFHGAVQMYHCKDQMSFEICFEVVKENLEKARKMQQELSFQIIKLKKNNRSMEIPTMPSIKQTTTTDESISDKLTRQMAWYGIKFGALIAVGAAFFASGVSAFIAEYALFPELFKGDQVAASAINALSGWFYLLLLLGGLLIGIGLMRGKQLTKAEKI